MQDKKSWFLLIHMYLQSYSQKINPFLQSGQEEILFSTGKQGFWHEKEWPTYYIFKWSDCTILHWVPKCVLNLNGARSLVVNGQLFSAVDSFSKFMTLHMHLCQAWNSRIWTCRLDTLATYNTFFLCHFQQIQKSWQSW